MISCVALMNPSEAQRMFFCLVSFRFCKYETSARFDDLFVVWKHQTVNDMNSHSSLLNKVNREEREHVMNAVQTKKLF